MKIDKEAYAISIKESLKELLAAFKAMFPKNIKEVILLLFLVVVYSSFGWVIANETCIQDCLIKRFDVYFSYDVGMRFHGVPFGFDVAHPLFNLYSTPISLVLEFFADLYANYKIKTIGFAMICNVMVSFSVVYIYRYLVEIVKIKNIAVQVLLVLFYGFSFTCLVLSFTIETYAFSIFFLSFFVYYYSLRIQNGKKFKFLTNLFYGFVLGGITITNTAVAMFPMFFVKEKFTKTLKRVLIIGCILSVCFLVAMSRGDMVSTFIERFTQARPEEATEFLFFSGWKALVGGAILFPDIAIITDMIPKDIAITAGLEYKDYFMYQINAVPFLHIREYIFIIILTGLIFMPLFTDFRNKLVQLLFLFFAFNIVLHLFIQFGILEAYIYGGHWMYIIPLLFGWGYKSLSGWKQYTYIGTIGCLLVYMLVNNSVRLMYFIEQAKLVWPAESYKW